MNLKSVLTLVLLISWNYCQQSDDCQDIQIRSPPKDNQQQVQNQSNDDSQNSQDQSVDNEKKDQQIDNTQQGVLPTQQNVEDGGQDIQRDYPLKISNQQLQDYIKALQQIDQEEQQIPSKALQSLQFFQQVEFYFPQQTPKILVGTLKNNNLEKIGKTKTLQQPRTNPKISDFKKGSIGRNYRRVPKQQEKNKEIKGKYPIIGCSKGKNCLQNQLCRYNMCIKVNVIQKIDKILEERKKQGQQNQLLLSQIQNQEKSKSELRKIENSKKQEKGMKQQAQKVINSTKNKSNQKNIDKKAQISQQQSQNLNTTVSPSNIAQQVIINKNL